jgi:16S rRNA processing protein RimM
MAATEPYAAIGRVTKTHGLNGEVSVVFDGEASLVVREGLLVWFVPPPRQVSSSRIVQTRPGPKGTLVSFEDVTTVDRAASLVGCGILARSEDLPNEWEHADASDYVGFSVFDTARGDLGVVRETIITGANDVWIVDGLFGEVLIPVIDDVVLDIDEQERAIRVALLPGLLEDDDR